MIITSSVNTLFSLPFNVDLRPKIEIWNTKLLRTDENIVIIVS